MVGTGIDTTKSALVWTILIGGAFFVVATAVAIIFLLAAKH